MDASYGYSFATNFRPYPAIQEFCHRRMPWAAGVWCFCLMRWFKHDSDANADAKLKKVRIKYGMEGYGLYWYCLELIATGVEKHKITFELEHDSEIIAHDTGIHYERVQEMMQYMIRLELFESSGGKITCLKMAKRLDQSMTSNPEMRKIIDRIKQNHDGVMTESSKYHDGVMQDKTRLDKNRLEDKEKKGPKRKRFVPPTLEEVAAYCLERQNGIDPQTFIDFYQAKNWMVGKTKMADWKACVRTWEKRRQENEKRNGTSADKWAIDHEDTSWLTGSN